MQDLRRLPLAELLLRAALAFAFLYPPINALFDPYAWSGYFPTFLLTIAGSFELVLLHLFGLAEVALAVWILFGRNIRTPSYIAAALLIAIVVFNLNQFAVLFRDLSIALIALALAIAPQPHE